MAIYTRTGDTGLTSLFGGTRVSKNHARVELYGALDELNSWIGVIATQVEVPEVQEFLHTIQKDIFIISSGIAGNPLPLTDIKARVKSMEERMDAMSARIPKIHAFIIPGGVQLAALIHVVRSVCRRVERNAVSVNSEETIDPVILMYLNRLSDLFFILARFINSEQGFAEETWP